MRTSNFVLVSAVLMLAPAVFAQRAEMFGHYTYMQYNPTISGVNSRALNGGGGGAQWNVTPFLGVKGEFNGYGSTQVTMNVTSPLSTPSGIIPVGTYKTNATMFNYLVGPVVGGQVGRVKPFGEVLFGQMITNMYGDLLSQTIVGGSASAKGDQNPFVMAFGGGLDVSVNKHVSLRVAQMDWLISRYTNPFTSTNNQNSYRFLAGVVFKFGAQ